MDGQPQLDLFPFVGPGAGSATRYGSSRIVCWTKMNAESGEDLEQIIRRKEFERKAGKGNFLWGIGTALDFSKIDMSRPNIPVFFSKMISPAKRVDSAPDVVVVWRKYISVEGDSIELPPYALITSRGHSAKSVKTKHYALVCRTANALFLRNHRKFDPAAYRNVGGRNRQPGSSQVTALINRVASESNHGRYFINMKAELVPPYTIQLADPIIVTPKDRALLAAKDIDTRQWLKLVAKVRRSN
jgi:hypothetical protein